MWSPGALENRQSLTGNVPGEERTFAVAVSFRDRFKVQISLWRLQGERYAQSHGSGWNKP